MDAATMRAQLSDPRLPFQRPAMEWAREHPAEAAPVLLSMIAICAKPGDLTEREANGAFFALPLLAELQETRAFPTLCALARNGDRLEEIFGDFGAENLHRLIVALCADDLAGVRAVAKDGGVEPSIRASFLQAWTVLVLRSGAHAAAFDDFAAFGKTLVGADAGILPYDLANALIVADPFRAMPLIQDAYARGDLDPSFTDISDYTQEASTWRDDPAGMRDTFLFENGPIADVIGFMDQWFERIEARIASGRDNDGSGGDEQDFSQAANPYREVGRNDPCPCGSGKKFKKCCLPTLDEPAIPPT